MLPHWCSILLESDGSSRKMGEESKWNEFLIKSVSCQLSSGFEEAMQWLFDILYLYSNCRFTNLKGSLTLNTISFKNKKCPFLKSTIIVIIESQVNIFS